MKTERELNWMEKNKAGYYVAYVYNWKDNIHEQIDLHFCNKKQAISKLRNQYNCVVSHESI